MGAMSARRKHLQSGVHRLASSSHLLLCDSFEGGQVVPPRPVIAQVLDLTTKTESRGHASASQTMAMC